MKKFFKKEKKKDSDVNIVLERSNHVLLNTTDDFVPHEYNCGGYALGEIEWVDIPNRYLYDKNDRPVGQEEKAVEYLENNYEIRKINSEKELLPEEDLVLFRLEQPINFSSEDEYGYEFESLTNDYHFVRIFKDTNEVYHKMGPSEIEEFDKKNLYKNWDCGWHNYRGQIFLFGINKKKRLIYGENGILQYSA